jgi:integrase
VSLYQRTAGGPYHVEVEWRGYPRLRLSTGTGLKARAKSMERTLYALKSAGRRDILGLLAASRLKLSDVHDDYLRAPADLEHRIAQLESPALGPLVDRWLAWLRSPAALSARTRRPFAPRTIERYSQSWQRFFALLLRGRETLLREITKGFIADYRARRREGGTAAATVNRDLCALAAFWSWCNTEEGLAVDRPAVAKEREPSGRERWLSSEEITALEEAVPPMWWPLFALLTYTGLRIGEAQGLLWGDVRLPDRRLTVTDHVRRLKTGSSARDVPIPEPLAVTMAAHRRIRSFRLRSPTTEPRAPCSSAPALRRSSMMAAEARAEYRSRTPRSTTSATPLACTAPKRGCRSCGCRNSWGMLPRT